MKLLTTLGILCTTGSAATAWPMLTPALIAAKAAIPAAGATAIALETQDGDDIPDTPVCIYNFSKDDCGGVVEPGRYSVVQCPNTGCRTVIVRGAVYKTDLRSSGLACGIVCETLCDGFPDGTLTLTMNYMIRADSCCPHRGSWEGSWTYAVPGRVFTGRAHGTIGVGTNRASDCIDDHDNCEPCHDVRLADGAWYIGFEGSFQGSATTSVLPYAEDLNFTMDGTWIVGAGAEPFREAFRVYNRFDGANIRWSCN
jgi:hypothetical protein